jgi:hypothetical protein
MTASLKSVELSLGAEGTSNPSAPKGGLSVYPSPAKGSITVESSLNNVTVSIYDVVGKKVYRDELIANHKTIDVSKFLPGNYIVQLVDPSTGLRMTRRFVKE